MIKRHWISRYAHPLILDGSRILQSWDTAQKGEAQNDYSVCTTWAWRDNSWFLIDVSRGRFDYPTLKARAIDRAKAHQPEIILIEEAGVGVALAAELKDAGLPAVPIKPDRDKVARMSVQSGKFQSGLVYLPKDAPWLSDLWRTQLFGLSRTTALSTTRSTQSPRGLGSRILPVTNRTDKALDNLQRFVFWGEPPVPLGGIRNESLGWAVCARVMAGKTSAALLL